MCIVCNKNGRIMREEYHERFFFFPMQPKELYNNVQIVK